MDQATSPQATALSEKPVQSFWGLWNISFGFFGIQIGFALQNANMSRVFQSLGSAIDDLPALWVAAPLTGLLVQPIIGHLSDKTWLGKLGRRRPYFLLGAVLAALSLFLMPLSEVLIMAAVLLWVLDASLNISMEPFRAFVGDMLRKDQHTSGYAVQTAFIGAGAVVGSIVPWIMTQIGVANVATDGGIPDTVRYSFWIGAVALFLAVLWTVVTTEEYSPEQMRAFQGSSHESEDDTRTAQALASRSYVGCLVWIVAGLATILIVSTLGMAKSVYLLGALMIAYGVLRAVAISLAKNGNTTGMLTNIVGDFSGMPEIMKKLALVQFFSWSALFIMWVYTTPVVTQYVYGSTDTATAAYNDGANWVGWLFATYNGVAAIAALTLLPLLAGKLGKAKTHIVGLLCGAAGFAAFMVIRDPQTLLLAEIGIGIAWASILAMPYAILASSLPQQKLGVYMGLFNVFIVVPQLLVAALMGQIVSWLFPDEPIWTMAFAAATLCIAALAMLRVKVPGEDAAAS